MTDFSMMTGYEFEDYVYSLLKSLGFHVTQTAYSNDGGIDLIAEADSIFFKGKYIIQCKKWTAKVGQPEIRDLYGVVTSERANKGILITTSDFTEQAYAFANGKNIELINGESLAALESLPQHSINIEDSSSQIAQFNHERYDYLMRQYQSEFGTLKEYGVYHELMVFLWDYFWTENIVACKEYQVFDKIIDISQKALKRLRRKKRVYYYQADCGLNIFNAYIVSGRLYEATNLLIDEGDFYLDTWYPRKRQDLSAWEKGCFSLVDDGIRYSPKLKTRHLFSAYKLVGYERGRREMLNCQPRFVCSDRDNGTVGFAEQEEQMFCESAHEEYNRVINGFYDNVFFWSSVYFGDHKNSSISSVGSCGTDYTTFKTFSFIWSNFYSKENQQICSEIDKAFREHNLLSASDEDAEPTDG